MRPRRPAVLKRIFTGKIMRHLRYNLILSVALTVVVMTAIWLSGGNVVRSQEAVREEQKRPAFALLVGISNYKSKDITRIDGCENNVPALAETLTRDYGFPAANVKTLVNEAATRDAIIAEFQKHLLANAKAAAENKAEAAIVYYFCGHGSQYPDQDGDENDGMDETFVPYDARTGDVFDILDDEFDDLKTDLRPFTSNAVFILESCHSGTGTRGDSSDTLVSQEADADKRKRTPYKRRHPPSGPSDAMTYTEIAASLSYNTAKSETAAFCKCDKPMSLMTRALVQALKRSTPNTTYRSLMREVSTEVAVHSRQEPQLEGSRDTVLFGGAAKRTTPFIEIESVMPDGRIVIRAGIIHGLKTGSQVSVYSSDSATNTGRDGWLVNGVVERVGNTTSVVRLPSAKEQPNAEKVKVTSRVILASPVFGGGALVADLGPMSGDAASLPRSVAASLEKDGLVENGMVKLDTAASASGGVLALRRGKVKDIGAERRFLAPLKPRSICDGDDLKTLTENERYPAREKDVFYLTDGADNRPIYGMTFDPEDTSAAEKIASLIRDHTYSRNLRGLDNKASSLPEQIKVTLNSIPSDAIIEGCREGKITYRPDRDKFRGFQEITDGKTPIGSFFQLNIKNISGEIRRKENEFASGEAFHIAVLALTNKGEIRNAYGSSGANDALQDGKDVNITLRMTEPVGIERFVIVVSKDHIDLSFYETRGTRNSSSLLERLLTRSGEATRDARSVVDAPDRWGVIHMELNITDEK